MYDYEGFMFATLMAIAIVGFAICYVCGRVSASLVSQKGYNNTSTYFWLGFLTGVIGIVIAAIAPDKTPNPAVVRMNEIDELRKYKDLYDSGVITKFEYEVKKREILRR